MSQGQTEAAQRVVDLTGELIRTPSPNLPGDERAVADLVSVAMQERGLPTPTVHALEPHRPNLLATLDFGPGGRHLCLSGHLDTKPVGTATWATDPFDPVIVDGNLYGLGACDMKGAIAAMVEAAAQLAQGGHLAQGQLSLLFTADEENAAAFGARYLAEAGVVNADAIVIGEPGGIDTDWDHLHLGSRGIANFTVEVTGDQGHSSLSDQRDFVNASVAMAGLLTEFAQGFRPSAPSHPLVPGGPTVNAGVLVTGGVNFGVVPGHAEFSVDVRTLPGMDKAQFEQDLRQFLAESQRRDPRLRTRVRFEDSPRDWLNASEVVPGDPVVVSARHALTEVFGQAPPTAMFPGTTDAAWFHGHAGVPTLPALGPGLLERAHAADEFVSLDALSRTPDVYVALIRHFCGS